MQWVLQGVRKQFFEIHDKQGCFGVRAFAAADQSNDEVSANCAHEQPIVRQRSGTDEMWASEEGLPNLKNPNNPFG
jgi:hypothetical protein